MINLKDKKIIGIGIVSIVLFAISFFMYKDNKDKAFKEDYMAEVFEETSSEVTEEALAKETDTTKSESSDSNIVAKKNTIVVEIKGEVIKPDVYELTEGSIVKDLIEMAGGLKDEADIRNINRAEQLQNHQLIIIGNVNDEQTSTSEVVISANSSNDQNNSLININTAKLEDLKKITGIGDTKAQNIIDYREKNGGFKSLEELKNVDGIGDKTFEKIKEQITL